MRPRILALAVFAAFAAAAPAPAAEPVHFAGGDARTVYKAEIESQLTLRRALLNARQQELTEQIARLEEMRAEMKDPKKKKKPTNPPQATKASNGQGAQGGKGGDGKAAGPMRAVEKLSLIGYVVAGISEEIRYLRDRIVYLEGLLAAL